MNISNVYTLLDGATANGDGPVAEIAYGGIHKFAVNGTFDSSTATLKILGPDGANYINVPNGALMAAGVLDLELPAGSKLLCTVSSAGAGTDLTATLSYVR